jgi:hypothetical protein
LTCGKRRAQVGGREYLVRQMVLSGRGERAADEHAGFRTNVEAAGEVQEL